MPPPHYELSPPCQFCVAHDLLCPSLIAEPPPPCYPAFCSSPSLRAERPPLPVNLLFVLLISQFLYLPPPCLISYTLDAFLAEGPSPALCCSYCLLLGLHCQELTPPSLLCVAHGMWCPSLRADPPSSLLSCSLLLLIPPVLIPLLALSPIGTFLAEG